MNILTMGKTINKTLMKGGKMTTSGKFSRRWVWFAVGLVLVCSSAGSAQDPVTGARDLPQCYEPGQLLSVSIVIDVDEANRPSGLIVKEYVPLDPSVWTISASTPMYNNFDATTGEIKWIFFGGTVQDVSITYTAQIPAATTGTETFSGVLRYTVSGVETEVPIGGDTDIDKCGGVPLTCGITTAPSPASGNEPLTVAFTGSASGGVAPVGGHCVQAQGTVTSPFPGLSVVEGPDVCGSACGRQPAPQAIPQVQR